jgi:predicted nuclease of predicted toxin-antitoxin system
MTAQMKLILDEDLPHELISAFRDAGHEVVHVEDLGWKGIKNGDLLGRISGTYDVLVTSDSNMPHQQNLGRFDVAIVQLHPRLKVIAQLLPLVPAALEAIPSAPKRAVTIIEPS